MASNCRLCEQPLHPILIENGRRGCSDCEAIYLKAEIAKGVLSGVMPDWWIDPWPWDELDLHDDMRGPLPPPVPYGET